MMNYFDLTIVGGGASGLCAAIEAARTKRDLKVAILEKLPRVGKKILSTGNGRCNMTNLNAYADKYNVPSFAKTALNCFGVQSNLDFFKSIGLFTVSDSEGRVYPMSNTSSSVLDALRFEAERLGVVTICDTPVNDIRKERGLFIINNIYSSRAVILAAGGRASPSQGSDGSGYKLLKALGHSVTEVFPSLVQLRTKTDFVKQLKGIRTLAEIKIYIGNHVADSSRGEILFTDYGLSGIAVFEVSRSVSEWQSKKISEPCRAIIDLVPLMSEDDLYHELLEIVLNMPDMKLENMLSGILPKKIGQALCKDVLLYKSTDIVSILNKSDILALAKHMKAKSIDIKGTNGFEQAQVTAGGAMLKEINCENMQSCKVESLYVCGELLDVDGNCGGYNLQWAWSSGRLAGKSAAAKISAETGNTK